MSSRSLARRLLSDNDSTIVVNFTKAAAKGIAGVRQERSVKLLLHHLLTTRPRTLPKVVDLLLVGLLWKIADLATLSRNQP